MALRFTIGRLGKSATGSGLSASAMGRQGQPVRRLRRDRGHGHRHQRRRRHGARTSRRAMVELSGRDIPRLAASLQLSEQSASLASQGPALLASQSEEMLKERAKKMKETQAVTLTKLGEIIELGADKTVVSNLAETVKNIDDMIKSLGNAARERLETGAQHEKLYGAAAQRPGRLRQGRRSRDDRRADPAQRHLRRPRFLAGRSNQGGAGRRPARRRRRRRQSDGVRPDRRAFVRTAATRSKPSRRNSAPRRSASNRISICCPTDSRPPRFAAAALKCWRWAKARPASSRFARRSSTPPITARLFSKKAASSMSASASACSSSSSGVRNETDASTWQARKEISLATIGHAGARRAHPDRIRAVRLALCRPQHPAADRQSAALDAGFCPDGDLEIGNLSLAASTTRSRDGEFAGGVPREHDRGPRAERRPGQGPHRQGRARLAHGGPDRRIRSHRPHRARQPADLGQFDAEHGAEHVGDRRSIQRAGERGGVRRRGNLGQRADRVRGHRGTVVIDLRNRPPGGHFGADRPQGRRRSRRPPTPPCRGSPTTPAASASWST